MSIYAGKQILFLGTLNQTLGSLKKLLSDEGAVVRVVGHEGHEVEVLKERLPDLIILNKTDAEADSIEVLNELRTSDAIRNLPVIVLVDENPDEIQNALALGAADYFTKDENVTDIEAKIKSLLGHSENFAGATVIDITPVTVKNVTPGVRVYVVEDDPLLRNLLNTKFEQSKFPCRFSVDGKGVLEEVKVFKPQVIILDLMLPGIGGFEILEEIKRDSATKEIPVIIFSNRDEQSDRKRAAELGVEKYFVKALTELSELVDEIGELAK